MNPNPLNIDNARDIITIFNNSYTTEDMVLLTVTAARAANFIETWILEHEAAKLLNVKKSPQENIVKVFLPVQNFDDFKEVAIKLVKEDASYTGQTVIVEPLL